MAEKRQVKNKNTYFSKLNATFRAARFDKRYWKTFSIDLIYSAIIGLILALMIFFGSSYLQTSLESFSELGTLEALESQDLNQIMPLLLPVISVLIGFAALFILANFLIGSVFKGWIWRTIMDKKMSFSFFLRYAGFRLIMAVAISLVFILALFSSSQASSLLIIIFILAAILLVHLFAVGLIFLARDNIVWQSIKKGFKKGIKVYLFLLPYLFFLVLLIVRGVINGLFQSWLVKTPTISDLPELLVNLIPYLQSMLPYLIISSIIGLFFAAYMRIFFAEFVKKV